MRTFNIEDDAVFTGQ